MLAWWTVNLLFLVPPVHGKEIQTNSVRFPNAPEWLTEAMVEKGTRPVQDFLQWDMHRLPVYFHPTHEDFRSALNAEGAFVAFFRRTDSTMHLGPKVTAQNFQRIFSHEVVHAVFYQKYKGAIPSWLEEGLANYVGKTEGVDYAWLAKQPIADVTGLSHPIRDPEGSRFHYQTSTALVEMIASHCSLHDLLELSVGKKVETYLSTFCEIPDVNKAYREWLDKKAQTKPAPKAARRRASKG
ncbi:hypothetical protein K2X33_08645 [bacterium]|nr:hypothetical protein [bacterium]